MSRGDDPFPVSKTVTVAVRLVARNGRREELLETLRLLVGRFRAAVGCARCMLHEDVQNGDALEFIIEWRYYEAFVRQVQSRLFRQLLIAMELSAEPPVVEIRTVCCTRGMELLFEILAEDEASSV